MPNETGRAVIPAAVVIEIGSRSRRIDPRQSTPRSLQPVPGEDVPILSWVLHALTMQGLQDITYIGDYHIEKVIERFPDLMVRYLRPGVAAGEVAALLHAELAPATPVVVVRGATVVLPEAISALPDEPLVTTTYGEGDGRRPAGIIRLGASVVENALRTARELVMEDSGASLEDLTSRMERNGHHAVGIDLEGLAAHADDRTAVMRTIFQGKAATLDNLAPLARSATVATRVRFTVREWQDDPSLVVRKLQGAFTEATVVVRSSTRAEDGADASHAGVFLSRADVDVSDSAALASAITEVIASYSARGRSVDPSDEVLVQEQIRDLRASGVLLTRDPLTGAPYFVVNLESASGRSDVVTSGGAGIESHYVLWGARPDRVAERGLSEVVRLGHELIGLSSNDALDIEWGIDTSGRCHLFQARPLAASAGERVADEDVIGLVRDGAQFVGERMQPQLGLAGRTTVLGTMPDWNPAEILGPAPRPLALSLYQHVLGDEAWATARARAGYRDVRPEALVISIGGRPYVDVRASLNSFLPAGVDDNVANRWLDACLERLRDHPELHDKIEFEIAITSLSPRWPLQRPRHVDAGLAPDEVEDLEARLRRLTLEMVTGLPNLHVELSESLRSLGQRRERLMHAGGNKETHSLARRLRHLLDDCRRLGVVPFAMLARCAFVGLEFLRGFRDEGILDPSEYEQFLLGIPTVASELSEATSQLARGDLLLEDILQRFGHLRPNSYEITSPSYREDPGRYFALEPSGAPQRDAGVAGPQRILHEHADPIRGVLDDLGLEFSIEQLGEFIELSVAGRELSKFEFMKNIDAALETIAALGEQLGYDRDEMSFSDVTDLTRLDRDSVSDATRSNLGRTLNVSQKQWLVGRSLRLPDLICDPADLQSFELDEWRPNFVTRKRVVAPAVWLDDPGHDASGLGGRIVVIRAADPGYDWIFGQGIAGLITEYGGAASHMAIRAGEFGLPAAIGCGQRILDRIRRADIVELDCEMERIRGVR